MMNKIKKLVMTSAVVGCLAIPSLGSAEVGGWSEDKGYSDPTIPTSSSNVISPFAVQPGDGCNAANKPQSHKADKIPVNGNDNAWKVRADTKWACKYHYSRARFENKSGTIKGDSKRQYGTAKSSATSGVVDVNLTTYVAKTYWGADY